MSVSITRSDRIMTAEVEMKRPKQVQVALGIRRLRRVSAGVRIVACQSP